MLERIPSYTKAFLEKNGRRRSEIEVPKRSLGHDGKKMAVYASKGDKRPKAMSSGEKSHKGLEI